MWLVSISLIFGPWMVWKKTPLSMFVWSMSTTWRSVKSLSATLLKDCGFQNVTIEVDEDLATHRAHKRKIEELEAGSRSWA